MVNIVVGGLSIDEDHGLCGDLGAVPINFCDGLAWKGHRANGVEARSLFHDGIDVRNFLFLKRALPQFFHVRIIPFDIFISTFLEKLTLRCGK